MLVRKMAFNIAMIPNSVKLLVNAKGPLGIECFDVFCLAQTLGR